MANYKINRNKPAPSDASINRHKNFGKLVNDHQKLLKYKDATRPLYKNPRFFGLITVLGVVMLVFFLNEDPKQKSQNEVKDSVSTTTDVKIEELKIDSTSENTVKTDTPVSEARTSVNAIAEIKKNRVTYRSI